MISKITINLSGTPNQSLDKALDLAFAQSQSLEVNVKLEYGDRIYELTPQMSRSQVEELKLWPEVNWQFENKTQ